MAHRTRIPRIAFVAAAISAILGVVGFGLLDRELDSFEREVFDPGDARKHLATEQVETPAAESRSAEPETPATAETAPVPPRNELLTALVVGSDAIEGRSGSRADVIMLVMIPPGESRPVVASIPRDLWVANPCTGGQSRINAGLNGCGSVGGPELLGIMVEDLAEVKIDHYAAVDFEGFPRIIDGFGGLEICTDYPVRDRDAELDLPGGCINADGETALAWVRSRKATELVDGQWRTVIGADDLARNARQREVLLEVAARATSVSSLARLTHTTAGLRDAVTLDDSLNVSAALGLAWSLRGVELRDSRQVEIPVRYHTTSGGASVLLPEDSLAQLLRAELDSEESPALASGG